MMKQKCKTVLHGKHFEEKMKDFYEFREQKKILHLHYIIYIYIYRVRRIFLSNQIIQKISFSLWFWASDLLFD